MMAARARPLLLFETALPVRYYLPTDDVLIELVPSQTRSVCPYKGVATWWSARTGDRTAQDIAWSYPSPVPENPRIAGLICFRNEWVDLTVDVSGWSVRSRHGPGHRYAQLGVGPRVEARSYLEWRLEPVTRRPGHSHLGWRAEGRGNRAPADSLAPWAAMFAAAPRASSPPVASVGSPAR
jgi:uncharacterized protein (DUF427 family)